MQNQKHKRKKKMITSTLSKYKNLLERLKKEICERRMKPQKERKYLEKQTLDKGLIS